MSNKLLMLNLDIPQAYQDMLLAVRQVFPSAIIAGGSLRDLHYGKTPKDVDIFIHGGGSFDMDMLDADLEELYKVIGKPVDIFEQDIEYGSNNSRDVVLILKYLIDEVAYDIIFQTSTTVSISGNNVEDIIGSFDMSICQIAFNGEVTDITQGYLDTYRHKVIHMLRVDDRSDSRIARIKEKFPDFTVKMPSSRTTPVELDVV